MNSRPSLSRRVCRHRDPLRPAPYRQLQLIVHPYPPYNAPPGLAEKISK